MREEESDWGVGINGEDGRCLLRLVDIPLYMWRVRGGGVRRGTQGRSGTLHLPTVNIGHYGGGGAERGGGNSKQGWLPVCYFATIYQSGLKFLFVFISVYAVTSRNYTLVQSDLWVKTKCR